MVIYSHSRLSTFEQCRLKFKYKYIDKIVPEIESTIEAYLGSIVHDTLEWMYSQIQIGNIPSVHDIITRYATTWQEKYSQDILIIRKNLTVKDYFNKGVEYLTSYYIKHHPFDDKTLEVEKRIIINLDEDGQYKLQGFIDRLVHNPKHDRYEVHDYKTANSLPTREKVDTDRQLALYSIAIKELFGQDKEVLLVWHYLAHNTKIQSKRTNQQLEELKQNIIELIKEIESTAEFPAQKSALCNWCEYKTMCPMFGGVVNERQRSVRDF